MMSGLPRHRLLDLLNLAGWVVSEMAFIFLGRELSEFDFEARLLLLLPYCVLLALVLHEVETFKRDDHVQAGHSPVEGVGDQQRRVEVVQRAEKHDTPVSVSTE